MSRLVLATADAEFEGRVRNASTRAVGLAVLSVVLVAYVGGAAAGAAAGRWRGAMVVPLGVVIALAVASARSRALAID